MKLIAQSAQNDLFFPIDFSISLGNLCACCWTCYLAKAAMRTPDMANIVSVPKLKAADASRVISLNVVSFCQQIERVAGGLFCTYSSP
jgi:hypothetical protein